MRILRLRADGFRHLHALDIAFGDDVVVITGAAGAGKSTLIEAMLWSLFGAGAVRGGEATLMERNPTVTLELDHGGVHCTIVRTLERVTFDGSDGTHIEGAEAVDRHVTTLLGAAEEFLRASVTGRRELQLLVSQRPAERMRTLARLLGMAPSPAQSPLHDTMRTLESEIAASDARIATLREGTELLTQYTPELERARADLEEAEREAERLHDEWAQKRQDVDTRLAAYRRRMEEITGQIEKLSQAGATGACPTCEQPLSDGVDLLVTRLDDELYTASQDIKWLAQRQAQLVQRPPDVAAADTRRARLRELVADRTERVARCEQAMQELWTVATDRRRAAAYLDTLREALHTSAAAAAPALDGRTLARLERHASDIVAHVSRKYTGVALHEDGRAYLRRGSEVARVVGSADEDLLMLALRTAVMRVLQEGRSRTLVIMDEPFGLMEPDTRSAFIELLRSDAHVHAVVCTSAPADGAITLERAGASRVAG